MKKILLLVLLLNILVLSSCKDNNYIYQINLNNNFNTINVVKIISEKKVSKEHLEVYENDMNDILNDVSYHFDNLSNKNSLVSLVNQNAGKKDTKVDDVFIDLLKQAIEVSKYSEKDGKALFDISINPVWLLWNFNDSFVIYEKPSDNEINSLLQKVNYKNIVINENEKTVYLKEEGMSINFGAIGKGYASDLIKEYLSKQGIKCAIIDIGSNILLLGDHYSDEYWTVYLKTPIIDNKDDFYFGTIKVKEASVVTSGSYEKYQKDEEGSIYHHILDPRTGRPVDNSLVSVTVICDESKIADSLATTFFAQGLEEGLENANLYDDLEAVFVSYENGKYKVYETSGINVILNSNLKNFEKGN